MGLISVLWVVVAPVAGADPAEPTNYLSTVESITPETEALEANVVGGDGFLQITVTKGHKLTADGYQGEPWLRISEDGTVEINTASPTKYSNKMRFGAEIPPGITVKNATRNPVWKTNGKSGRYVWHDHRIHYMTPSLPPRLVPGTRRVAIGDGPGGRWQVPVTLDGTPTTITGTLELFDAPNQMIPWGIALLTLAVMAAVALVKRTLSIYVAAAVTAIAGGLGVWAGFAELAAVPAAAGGNPLAVVLPAFSILTALIASLLRSDASRVIALFAGAASLGAWSLLRISSFSKAFPLGDLSAGLTRYIIALALGAAVGTIVAGVASGGLALQLDTPDSPETSGGDMPDGPESADPVDWADSDEDHD